ncbi:MAG: hypothetical protein LLG44_09395 [Chloroflexi bacterium]|nr:hypothetical protein [Chloroflexota bacterium]
MAGELALYISAAHEQDAECEQIGRLLAERLVTIRWRIWRTPLYGNMNPDQDSIAASPFYVILLGTDLVAPMGVEWQIAAHSGVFIIAFRDETCSPSPAADYFARNTEIAWQPYKKSDEFILAFEHILLTQLINGTPGYGLALDDIELISARLQTLESLAPAPQGTRQEAGQGGVILTAG